MERFLLILNVSKLLLKICNIGNVLVSTTLEMLFKTFEHLSDWSLDVALSSFMQ